MIQTHQLPSNPIARGFVRAIDRLPNASQRTQNFVGWVVLISQAGICVTGAIVRVTSSGLGCPTWPQCFPGSFTPEPHPEVAVIHQAVEFGNRMLSLLVTLAAIAIVLVVIRARRRREVLVYAWLIPGSTIVQAVVGGISVRLGLAWWSVALHMLLSLGVVWLSVLLLVKIKEPDDGKPVLEVPVQLRWLTALSALAMAATTVAGSMVTGAGPHAGDQNSHKPVPRLRIEINDLVHLHADFLIVYLALLVALGFALFAVGASDVIKTHLFAVIGLVVVQASVGIVQYLTNVPSSLVVLHVGLAAICVAATAALWSSQRPRVAAAGTASASRREPISAVH